MLAPSTLGMFLEMVILSSSSLCSPASHHYSVPITSRIMLRKVDRLAFVGRPDLPQRRLSYPSSGLPDQVSPPRDSTTFSCPSTHSVYQAPRSSHHASPSSVYPHRDPVQEAHTLKNHRLEMSSWTEKTISKALGPSKSD